MRRPEALLDEVRAGMSTFARMRDVEPGVARLRSELADGRWHRKYGALLELDQIDAGYRIVIAAGVGSGP